MDKSEKGKTGFTDTAGPCLVASLKFPLKANQKFFSKYFIMNESYLL